MSGSRMPKDSNSQKDRSILFSLFMVQWFASILKVCVAIKLIEGWIVVGDKCAGPERTQPSFV